MDGNFKMRCINNIGANSKKYTMGKIYEVINGHWTTDDGFLIGDSAIKTIKDVNYRSCGVFELVEEEETPETIKKELSVSERMQKVAEMLGVELGEEFNITGHAPNPFKITEKGIMDKNGYVHGDLLGYVISGKYTIEKLPWKPKKGEKVWTLNLYNQVIWIYFIPSCPYHVSLYKMGWLFRTKEEAKENKERVFREMREVIEDE